MKMPRILMDLAEAFRFLTRAPMPALAGGEDALARSSMFFPVAGMAVGAVAALLFVRLSSHLPATVAALAAVLFTALATGGLHEDGLADAADAFGGGWSRAQILEIMKDSRIGSYGAMALVFSIAGRALLIAALPPVSVFRYIVTAHVLSRWIILPLGFFLPAARRDAGQGARLAHSISRLSMLTGTAFAFAAAAALLGLSAAAPILAVLLVALLAGAYYRRRIGGITGDCFGAAVQFAEIGVYLVGAWRP